MLNVLTADESEKLVQKITEAKPEETRRMKAWLEERVSAGKKKSSAEIVTLTPVLAQLLLDCNPINRPINRLAAGELASDIAGGRWMFNGESIVVSNTGVLLDGQHRCLQVIQTKHPVETVIVFGPKDDARFTIDTGRSKTISNFLSMKGRAYSAVLASAISYYLQYRSRGYIIRNSRGVLNPTKAEVLAGADEMGGIDRSIDFTHTCMKTTRCHAALAFCHYVFWKKTSREAADHFIGRIIDGEGLRRGDPIMLCRNRLMNSQKGRGVEPNSRLELIFKCWNAHRLNHGLESVKLKGGMLPKVER